MSSAAVAGRELAGSWRGPLVADVAIFATLLLGMAVYARMDVGIFDTLPAVARNLMGVPEGAGAETLAYSYMLDTMASMVLGGIAIAIGARAVAGEEGNGTLALVLGAGASRPRFAAWKGLALALLVTASGILVWVSAELAPVLLGVNKGEAMLADALTHLGLDVMAGPAKAQEALDRVGICFMMAPMHHPAMRHVGPARAELGTRTIFNILGPLTSPAGVKRQLTGAFSADWLRPMAETLRDLGSDAAWLVHGGDGTDELAISAPSRVAGLRDGQVSEFEIAPEDAGLPVHPFEDIVGGDPAHNADALRALLDGSPGAYRDAVLLNAAAALLVAGKAADLREGAAMARESIDSGAAKARLAGLAAVSGPAA